MAVKSLNVNVNYNGSGGNDYEYDVVGGLYALPEGCIANALSLTSPRDAFRLSLVASKFCRAAQSDAVWERFLPSDYKEIISRSIDGPDLLSFESKKKLYLHLCDHPILIDGGTKSFSLEKRTGKKCFMLAPGHILIVWADRRDLEHWRWISSFPSSRFPEVPELVFATWIEIRGKINTSMLSPDTTYAAYVVFTVSQAGLHLFDDEPARCSVGIIGQESTTRLVYLDPQVPRDGNSDYPRQRGDGWMEVLLGEFYVMDGQQGELELLLMHVKGPFWKRGLIIGGIEIRPKVE